MAITFFAQVLSLGDKNYEKRRLVKIKCQKDVTSDTIKNGMLSSSILLLSRCQVVNAIFGNITLLDVSNILTF